MGDDVTHRHCEAFCWHALNTTEPLPPPRGSTQRLAHNEAEMRSLLVDAAACAGSERSQRWPAMPGTSLLITCIGSLCMILAKKSFAYELRLIGCFFRSCAVACES